MKAQLTTLILLLSCAVMGQVPYHNDDAVFLADLGGNQISPITYDSISIVGDSTFVMWNDGDGFLFNARMESLGDYRFKAVGRFQHPYLVVSSALDGTWGILDITTRKKTPEVFKAIIPTNHGLHLAKSYESDNWGVIDVYGSWLVKPEFGAVLLPEGIVVPLIKVIDKNRICYPSEKSGYFEILNISSNSRKAFRHDSKMVPGFFSGYAIIEVDGSEGLINARGDMLVRPTYKRIVHNRTGKYIATHDSVWYALDLQGIKRTPFITLDSISNYLRFYGNGIYRGKNVVFDFNGDILFETKALLHATSSDGYFITTDGKNNWIVNERGRRVGGMTTFHIIDYYREGDVAVVQEDGKHLEMVYHLENGERLVPESFLAVEHYSGDVFSGILESGLRVYFSSKGKRYYSFSNRIEVAFRSGSAGLRRAFYGDWVLQPRYDTIAKVGSDLFVLINENKKFVYNNRNGRQFGPFQEADVVRRDTNVFVKVADHKVGLITADARFIIPRAFEEIIVSSYSNAPTVFFAKDTVGVYQIYNEDGRIIGSSFDRPVRLLKDVLGYRSLSTGKYNLYTLGGQVIDGLADVENPKALSKNWLTCEREGDHVVYNARSKEASVVKYPIIAHLGRYNGRDLLVFRKRQNKIGIMDQDLTILVKPAYHSIGDVNSPVRYLRGYSEDLIITKGYDNVQFERVGRFQYLGKGSDKFILSKEKDDYVIVRTDLVPIDDKRYKFLSKDGSYLHAVDKEGKHGYLSYDGVTLVGFNYSGIGNTRPFGWFEMKTGETITLIGNKDLSVKFKDVQNIDEKFHLLFTNFCLLKQQGNWTLIDSAGTVLFKDGSDVIYDYNSDLKEGAAIIIKQGTQYGLYSLNQKSFLLNVQYDGLTYEPTFESLMLEGFVVKIGSELNVYDLGRLGFVFPNNVSELRLDKRSTGIIYREGNSMGWYGWNKDAERYLSVSPAFESCINVEFVFLSDATVLATVYGDKFAGIQKLNGEILIPQILTTVDWVERQNKMFFVGEVAGRFMVFKQDGAKLVDHSFSSYKLAEDGSDAIIEGVLGDKLFRLLPNGVLEEVRK